MKAGRSILTCALLVANVHHVAGASDTTPAKVSGATALALAGVIAPLSPVLSGAEKKAVAMLFAANGDIPYKKPIVVTADRIVCRTGNVDITVRNCEVTFGKKTKTVNGSFNDGGAEFFQRTDCFQPAAFVDRFPQVDQHDDAGLGGHAEAGDESNPHGDAEIHGRRVPAVEQLRK